MDLRATLAQYRRSLKAIEMEEPLDLVFYRPLGFLVAKLAARTSLGPDHVSLVSLAAGISAGALFWTGAPGAMIAGAACYFLCNVLDCADGQLARLRGSTSPVGYIIDGSIDYAATISVFVGITHALALRHPSPTPGQPGVWLLGLLALASMGWQCAVLDRKRHEWQSRVYGKREDPAAELATFRAQAEAWRREGTHLGGRALIAGYVFYRTSWMRFTPAPDPALHGPADDAWTLRNRPVLRAAVFMGSSMHMSAIIVAALAGRLDLYLWAALTLGNAWAVMVVSMQRHALLVARAV